MERKPPGARADPPFASTAGLTQLRLPGRFRAHQGKGGSDSNHQGES